MVTPVLEKEAENRALAWAYYWGKSLPAAVSEFDYVEQGGQELRAAGFKWSFQEKKVPTEVVRNTESKVPEKSQKSSELSGSVFTDRRVSFASKQEVEKPVSSDAARLEPVAEECV